MTEPNNTPAEPPPSYDDAVAGGAPGFQGQPAPGFQGQPVPGFQGQPVSYPPYPTQEGFKYDGVAPYPTQPGYPAQTGYPGQMPYPPQPGAQYPYGAPPAGTYPPPPPGTAVYNPQGGVTFINRNPQDQMRLDAQQRTRRILVFCAIFVAVIVFLYFFGRIIF